MLEQMSTIAPIDVKTIFLESYSEAFSILVDPVSVRRPDSLLAR